MRNSQSDESRNDSLLEDHSKGAKHWKSRCCAIKRVCGALTSQTFSKVFCVREGYKSLFTSLMVDGTSCPEQWADLGSLYE